MSIPYSYKHVIDILFYCSPTKPLLEIHAFRLLRIENQRVELVVRPNPIITEVIKTIVYAHISQEPNVEALLSGILGNMLPKIE